MSRYPLESRRFRIHKEPTKTSIKVSFILDIENNQLIYSLIVYLNTDTKKLDDFTFSPKDKDWKYNKCTWPTETIPISPNTIYGLLNDLKNEIIEQFMKSTTFVDFFLVLRNTDKTLFCTYSKAKIRSEQVSDYVDLYFDDLEFRILSEGLQDYKPLSSISF